MNIYKKEMSNKTLRQNAFLLIVPAMIISVFANAAAFLGCVIADEAQMPAVVGEFAVVIARFFGIPFPYESEFLGLLIKAMAFVFGLHAVGIILMSGISYLIFSRKPQHVLMYRIVMGIVLLYSIIPLQDCSQFFLTSLGIGSVQIWLFFYVAMLTICVILCGINVYTNRLVRDAVCSEAM